MQMVSAAQPFAQLAGYRTESMLARVNCVLLVSKQKLLAESEINHIGT
jgi:hypothetical protein